MNNTKIVAIVVAAGSGERFSGDVPKQYSVVNKRSILLRTIESLLGSLLIDWIRVVIRKEDYIMYDNVISSLKGKTSLLMDPVFGGKRRQDSVYNGLKSLSSDPPDNVLIHDGVRPFVSAELIQRVLSKLHTGSVAVKPIIPIHDTIIRLKDNDSSFHRLERENIYKVQTPQGFKYKELIESYNNMDNNKNYTDDIAVMQDAGFDIDMVQGDKANIKITDKQDLFMFAS